MVTHGGGTEAVDMVVMVIEDFIMEVVVDFIMVMVLEDIINH